MLSIIMESREGGMLKERNVIFFFENKREVRRGW